MLNGDQVIYSRVTEWNILLLRIRERWGKKTLKTMLKQRFDFSDQNILEIMFFIYL